jgi:hypothetical protein
MTPLQVALFLPRKQVERKCSHSRTWHASIFVGLTFCPGRLNCFNRVTQSYRSDLRHTRGHDDDQPLATEEGTAR